MKEKAELALKSSKWGEVAGGLIQGLGTVVDATVDSLKTSWNNLWGGGSKEEIESAGASATSAISIEPHPQYTAPLNAISLKSIDIAEDTELIQQKLGSLSANLTLKLDELSDKLSSIIKVMGGAASNTPGPVSFFKGVDIEA